MTNNNIIIKGGLRTKYGPVLNAKSHKFLKKKNWLNNEEIVYRFYLA